MAYILNFPSLRGSADRLCREALLSTRVAARIRAVLPAHLAKQEDCLTPRGTAQTSQGEVAAAHFRLVPSTASSVRLDLKTLRHIERWAAAQKQGPVADAARDILGSLERTGYADLSSRLGRWRSLRKRQGSRDNWTRHYAKAERVEVDGHVFERVRSLAELSSIGHRLGLCVAKGREQAPDYWKRLRKAETEFWSVSALGQKDDDAPSLVGLLSVSAETKAILEAQGRGNKPLTSCPLSVRRFARTRGLRGGDCADLAAVGLRAPFLLHPGRVVASGEAGGEPFKIWLREGVFRIRLGRGRDSWRWGYWKRDGDCTDYEWPWHEGAGLEEADAMRVLLKVALNGGFSEEAEAEVAAALD